MSICDPAADQRGDAEYKTAMAGEMTRARIADGALARRPIVEQGNHGEKQAVSFKLNGKPVDVVVEPRELLIHTLREKLQHTGPHIGCETSHCGACTVDLDGMSVKSCTVLTVQCDGAEVLTIEGFEQAGALHALQEAFHQDHGLQCGFCTPGMITRAYRLLKENPNPSEEEIRYWMAGNLCRCTGYQNIVKAVQSAAKKMRPQARLNLDAMKTLPENAMGNPLKRSSAKKNCRESALRGCARKTRASSAARAPMSTTSSCPACCSGRWCAAPMRMRASNRSTRARRWPCRAWSRC